MMNLQHGATANRCSRHGLATFARLVEERVFRGALVVVTTDRPAGLISLTACLWSSASGPRAAPRYRGQHTVRFIKAQGELRAPATGNLIILPHNTSESQPPSAVGARTGRGPGTVRCRALGGVLLGASALAGRTRRDHLRILVTRPEPTVRPPSRMAKPRPSSMAIGWMSSTVISVLSPGMTISVPSGSVMTPVTSVVRK